MTRHHDRSHLLRNRCVQAISRYAALLRCPDLRPALLEGLTASIGGLDASLATTASAALVDVLSCAAADKEAAPQLLLEVTGCLLEIWGRHARCTLHIKQIVIHRQPDAVPWMCCLLWG